MSLRQSHPASPTDGILGGAFVVVGFVVLVVAAAVDLITSRWSPSVPTTQVKDESKQASVAPLQTDEFSPTPDTVKDSIEQPKPLSDIGTLESTGDSSVLSPKSQESEVSYPPTRDLDDNSAAKAEESRAEVPLVQDRDLRPAEPAAAIHETAVPNDSSQEWVSLSKPDAESLSSIQASDVHPEVPTASSVPLQHEDPQAAASSSQQDSTLEFSSSALIDAPNKLHESAMIIGSDTSSPPPATPEPDNHSFDDAAVRIQTDAEKQVPLNPESSNVEFGTVGELKARTSTPSLYDSASSSINRGGTGAGASELSSKNKHGGSFIKKQRTLINKVFKNKDSSSDNGQVVVNVLSSSSVDNQPPASSFVSEPETLEHSTSGPDADTRKKLTSPSRVSLGSIRSITGSIKKKIGRSSTVSEKDVVSGSADHEPHLVTLEPSSNSSQPSKFGDAGPSLLKTMFKIRKSSK